MKLIILAIVAIALPLASARAYNQPLSGVYDENTTDTNQVDRNASGDALSSMNLNDVAAFSATVQNAAASGLGGVINFDAGAIGADSSIAAYSVGGGTGTLTMNVTPLFDVWNSSQYGTTAISGNGASIPGGFFFPRASNADSYTFTMANLTGSLASLDAVTQIGFTILGRTSSVNTSALAQVTYSDSSTGTANLINSPPTAYLEDTFVGFTAPAGLSIESFTINFTPSSGSDGRHGIDDLGFIVSPVPAPEPASFALLGIGGMLLFGGRRRNQRAANLRFLR